MDVLKEITNGSTNLQVVIIAGVLIIYSILHILYDILTKSEIEKIITYRGKDRIISLIVTFVLFFLTVIIVGSEEIAGGNKEGNNWIPIIAALIVSIICTALFIIIFTISHLILKGLKLYPEYELKLNDNGEYWRIFKVTKDNRVILKKDNDYLLLPDVKELENKIIREDYKKKINKN